MTLTENQQGLLRALTKADWRVDQVTSGQSRTANSLIARGLVEIERVGGNRWVRITDAGRALI